MIEMFVNIDNAQVQQLIKDLPAAIRRDVPLVVASAGAELTRSHITGIARSRHRPRVRNNFYQDAADSVISKQVADGAEISIPHVGFALRYEGGTIRPSGRISLVTGKPIKKLAIPIKGSPAEGRSPGEFSGVFVIKGKRKGTAFLAGKKSNGMIGLLFALVAKTEHNPDPSILPTDAQYQTAAMEAIAELLNEVI